MTTRRIDVDIALDALVTEILAWYDANRAALGHRPEFVATAKDLRKRLKFKSTRQAAAILKRSESYVRILCLNGKLTGAYKEGRGWRIPLWSISRHRAARRGPGRPKRD